MTIEAKPLDLPFGITVCGIHELDRHCERGFSHVLSILDPEAPVPPAFGAYGEHTRLELRFHDVIEEGYLDEGRETIAPTQGDVERVLAFGRALARPDGAQPDLLVHCHVGISRSTAALSLIVAQSRPDVAAREVFGELLRIRSKTWPNLRMIQMGDDLLGRRGELVSAAYEVYERQMRAFPGVDALMVRTGRAREVEAGRRVALSPGA